MRFVTVYRLVFFRHTRAGQPFDTEEQKEPAERERATSTTGPKHPLHFLFGIGILHSVQSQFGKTFILFNIRRCLVTVKRFWLLSILCELDHRIRQDVY